MSFLPSTLLLFMKNVVLCIANYLAVELEHSLTLVWSSLVPRSHPAFRHLQYKNLVVRLGVEAYIVSFQFGQ